MPHVLVVAHLLTNTSHVPRTNLCLTLLRQHKLQRFFLFIYRSCFSKTVVTTVVAVSHWVIWTIRSIFTRIGVSCTHSLWVYKNILGIKTPKAMPEESLHCITCDSSVWSQSQVYCSAVKLMISSQKLEIKSVNYREIFGDIKLYMKTKSVYHFRSQHNTHPTQIW